MREKAIYILAILAALVMIPNLKTVFMGLPDEAMQGAIYRIIFIHVPAAINAQVFFTVSLVTSILFLVKKNFLVDSLA